MDSTAPLLQIDNLSACIKNEDQILFPLQGVSFSIGQNTRMALVGESGSGKSLTAAAILGMLPRGSQVTRGNIVMGGRDLASLPEKLLQKIRGKEISIVFQNPGASLTTIQVFPCLIPSSKQVANVSSDDWSVLMISSKGILGTGEK